jgi:proteasome accessory factor B
MSPRNSHAVSKEDRLFSLILALIVSREGLTRAQIFRTVRGYVEAVQTSAPDAVARMFERDKDEIRRLGVVIDTVELTDDAGQTHNVRYRVSQGSYQFPADVSFSPREVALLQLAAAAWRKFSLSVDSRHALTKIRSLGISADPSLVGVAPRITAGHRSFAALEAALEGHEVVRFDYLKPGDQSPRVRTVAPLALSNWRGNWYLLAWDLDAQAERTFLLSRILTDPVKRANATHPRSAENYAARLLSELEQLAAQNIAVVETVEGSDAHLRLSARYGQNPASRSVSINFADVHLLADELSAYSTDIVCVSPPELATAIENGRERILALHALGAGHDD